jgi:hypothetical protein
VLGHGLFPAALPFSSVGLEVVGAMEERDRSLRDRRDVRIQGFHGAPHLADEILPRCSNLLRAIRPAYWTFVHEG